MEDLVKPDREPDIILFEVWHFYWDEMVQYNPWEDRVYKLVLYEEDEVICFDHPTYGLHEYVDHNTNTNQSSKIYEHYHYHLFCRSIEEHLDE